MSSSVFPHPRLKRRALWHTGPGMPIARRTWDGSSEPDEQADPDETATPFLSSAEKKGLRFDEFKTEIEGVGNALSGMAVQPDMFDAFEYSIEQAPAQPFQLDSIFIGVRFRLFRRPSRGRLCR